VSIKDVVELLLVKLSLEVPPENFVGRGLSESFHHQDASFIALYFIIRDLGATGFAIWHAR